MPQHRRAYRRDLSVRVPSVSPECASPDSRSRSRSVNVALFRVSVASTCAGSRAASWLAWRMRLRAFAGRRPGAAHPHRADVLLRVRRRRHRPARRCPCSHEIPVLVIAPQLAPGLAVGHHGPAAGAPHLGVQVARLLRRELLPLQPPRGDQQMRVPVRPLALAASRRRAGAVHVELHRQPLGDEVLFGERARQLDPVRVADRAFAGSASTISRATWASLRRSAASAAFHSTALSANRSAGALGQQHLVVLGRVAVPEVEHLAGALRRDRRALVIRRRAHRAAAEGARDVAGAGELDGHAYGAPLGSQCGAIRSARRARLPRCASRRSPRQR